jgi:hypothetical protein
VRLHGRLADDQVGGYPRVGQTAASQSRMSRSGTVSEASRDGAGSVCAGLWANASISRIVTNSASSASPAAAILTAALTRRRAARLLRRLGGWPPTPRSLMVGCWTGMSRSVLVLVVRPVACDISGHIGTDTPNPAGKLATGFCRGRALNNERSGREERRQGRLCGSKPGPFGSATWSLFPPIPAWRSRRAARKWVLVPIPDHLA